MKLLGILSFRITISQIIQYYRPLMRLIIVIQCEHDRVQISKFRHTLIVNMEAYESILIGSIRDERDIYSFFLVK